MSNQYPLTAFLFDVDGVLTPIGKQPKVQNPYLFREITKRLRMGMPIGFNTGRSSIFLKEKVLDPLESGLENKDLLDIVFASGEKGAVVMQYDDTQSLKQHVLYELSVPEIIKKEIQKLVEVEFALTMFWDATKIAMASVEYKPGTPLDVFQTQRDALVEKLERIVHRHKLETLFRVDPTPIATDVESVETGKDLGANAFVDFLEEKDIFPEYYITFGDAGSDYAMHQALLERNLCSTLIFVGDPNELAGKDLEHVLFPDSRNDLGTLEFLKSQY